MRPGDKYVQADKNAFSDASTVSSAFRRLQERLVVITRGAFADDVASLIASSRRVPVLVIEAVDLAGARIVLGPAAEFD